MSAEENAKHLRAFVARELSSLPFHAKWPTKVVAQDGEGKLELQPDGSTVPGEAKVPIRHGVPGLTVKVPAGTRVLLTYEEGDPARPVAEGWESGTPLEVALESDVSLSFKSADVVVEGSGTVSLKGGGQPAAEHVLTTEQLANILLQFFALVGPTLQPPVALAPAPPFPSDSNPSVLAFNAMLQAAAASPLPASTASAIVGAMASSPPKVGTPGAPVTMPGIGCKGVLAG